MPVIRDLRNYQPEPLTGRLLVLTVEPPGNVLAKALAELGMEWDQVNDVAQARQAFFAWGGHEAIFITPGIPAGIAREVVRSLRDMDPTLPIITSLDPAALGKMNPPGTVINDLDLNTSLGRRLFQQKVQTGISKARN